MSSEEFVPSSAFAALGVDPLIVSAIEARGYDTPTAVQAAMLAPELEGRDVLVSSQTGSGKTAAFGLLLAPSLRPQPGRPTGACAPRAVVIAPTRELAQQVREELAWLLAPLGARVLAVTGGTSVVGELRALSHGADVLVGTPGRLNDHLTRKAVDTSQVATVVLDEADEMLDMGFRDELEAILGVMPTERRTMMLSATLPPAIVALARRYMRDPARIAVDPPGRANADIAHVAHLVPPSDKLDAVVNILLEALDERVMVFVRTRAEAGEMAGALAELGFTAAPLTGEMAQRERTQTLDAFRAGRVAALIATDVAARGLDVPEVTRVVHADLPGDAATLTHRSGRTGRAGRKGVSVLLVPPFARGRANELLRAAGLRAQWRAVPSAGEIRAAAEARLRARLSAPLEGGAEDTAREALAASLLAETDALALVTRLLREVRWDGPCAPRTVRTVEPRPLAPRGVAGESRGRVPAPRAGDDHVMFRVNFGERHGATPSRLLAMVCRRGGIRGADVGAISIGGGGSTFGVARDVAATFASAAARTDQREPHVRIEPVGSGAGPAATSRWSDTGAGAPPPRRKFVPRASRA